LLVPELRKSFAKSLTLEEGRAIAASLRQAGWTVYTRYVDGFAKDGDVLRIHGAAYNRKF